MDLGSVEAYSKMTLSLKKDYDYNREQLIKTLVHSTIQKK